MPHNTRLEDRIDHFFISDEILIKKKQMDSIGYLVNGNMCFGIYGNLLVLRTNPALARSLVRKSGVEYFVPDDKAHYEFIALDAQIYRHDKALHKFLSYSFDYTLQLPPASTQPSTPLL
jgi:hypothetical protein